MVSWKKLRWVLKDGGVILNTYKVAQVAEMLQADPRTIKKEIERGRLKAIKVGSDYRIPEPNIIEFMQLTANNYKSKRELDLEREVDDLKKKLASSERCLSNIKNELLKVAQ